MVEFGRLITAMVTPFTPDGSVDYEAAKQLALALLDSGSDGVVVAGTTGEAATLSRDEKVRLFGEIKAAVGGRGSVIAYSGTNDTAASVELAKEAERAGVDAQLLIVPYYNKPPQEGIEAHFRAIASATSLPCILYNLPGRTAVNMTAETTVRLAQVDNIVGTKEASGMFDQVARIIEGAPEGFRVWSGDDANTLPVLALGGYGVISVAAHLVGRQLREMIESYCAGSVDAAARTHRRLLPLMQALFLATNPIPVKYALRQLGVSVGPLRLPLVDPDEVTAERIIGEVRRHQIDLPVAV